MKKYVLPFFFSLPLLASVEGIPKNVSFVDGCKISSLDFRPAKIFPGNRCTFLPDGSFLSAADKVLRLFSANNDLIWEHSNLWLHHQMNVSADGERILFLGSEIFEMNGKKSRGDTFTILEVKTGKVLHATTARALLAQRNFPLNPVPSTQTIKALNIGEEFSHFNSIYEIPEIKAKNLPSYLTKGNIIVNSKKELGFFILSPDLSKVLHQGTFPQSVRNYVHDVQVTPEGNYLIFNNISVDSSEDHPHSEINEIHPVSMKSVHTIKANPAPFFFSLFCGGVQKLNERYYFISHNYAGIYFYDRKTKQITMSGDFLSRGDWGILPTQQVKLYDVSEFLAKHSVK